MPMVFPQILMAACILTATGPDKMFTDVTAQSGIPPLKYAEGVNIYDLDGDGLPELFLPDVKGRDRLFKNLGGCRFRDVTDERGIKESGGIGGVVADLNGDGRPDIYVVRGAYPYGINVLYEQGSDGRFVDVADKAGVAGKKNGISAVAGDLDGDGLPELFVSNWGVNSLYRNTCKAGEMKFSDITKGAGLGVEGRSWGAVLGDFDGDGRLDIFVSRGGPDYKDGKDTSRLYINMGDGTFADHTASSGIAGINWSMGAVTADLDGDGSLDMFVTNYEGPDHLYLNDGKAHFRDVTEGSGISSGRSVGAAAGFVDGDLLPDIVVAGFQGPVKVFENLGGGKFEDVSLAWGMVTYKKNEGVALGDMDGDGDLDIYVANYDGHNVLYRNNLDGGSFIKVRPARGKASLAGAAVKLYRAGGLGRPDAYMARQDVQAGYGFCSQGPDEALFRLPGDGVYDIAVTLPDGRHIERTGVKPGVLEVDFDK